MKECPEGKVRNPDTGRCVKVKKECSEGKVRNPDTGRCVKVKKECSEGKVRNPDTGRCVKVKKECPEGKVRNPNTGRCVKVKKEYPEGKVRNPNNGRRRTKYKGIKERIQYQIVPENEIKRVCISENNILDDKIKIIKRIGTPSVYGEVFSACYPLDCKGEIALKKIALTPSDIKLMNNQYDDEALKSSLAWREVNSIKLVNSLVTKNICPSFPMIYGVYFCQSCKFENTMLQHRPDECLLIPNELANGDLKYLIKEQKLTKRQMTDAYFQIFVAIYCIQKYFSMIHNDLHWGNVLFHKINYGGYIKYIINNKEYVVRNPGYLMILWDFGLVLQGERYINSHLRMLDIGRIMHVLNKYYEGLFRRLYKIGRKSSSPLQFIENIFQDESLDLSVKEYKEDEIIAVYNTDTKL